MATLKRVPKRGRSALESSRSDMPSSCKVAVASRAEPSSTSRTNVPALARTRSTRWKVPLTGRAMFLFVIEVVGFERHDFEALPIFFGATGAGCNGVVDTFLKHARGRGTFAPQLARA